MVRAGDLNGLWIILPCYGHGRPTVRSSPWKAAIQDDHEVRGIVTTYGHVRVEILTVVPTGDLAILAVGVITHEERFPLV